MTTHPSRPSVGVGRRGFLLGSAALVGLGSSGLLSACSKTSSAGDGSGTLQMHHDAAVGPLFEPYVEYFNKHYKPLKLGTSYVAQDYLTVTNQQLAGGNAEYDVLFADEGYLESWSSNGWIVSVEDLPDLDKLVTDMKPGVAEALTGPDGKLYGLPYFWGAELFCVNQAHLKKINAEAPATWDEFVEQARELKSKKISSAPYSPYWIKYAFLMWHQFATETASEGGGELFSADASPQLEDNDVAAATLDRWRTLYAEGLVPGDIFTTDYGGVTNIFAGGKSSYSMRYQAQVVGWKDPEQSLAARDITNVMMPGSTHQTHSFGAYWMMSESADKTDAFTVIDYLGGQGKDGKFYVPKHLVAMDLGLSSGYQSVDQDPEVLKSWSAWADVDTLQKQLDNAVPLGPVTTKEWYPKFADRACATLQEVVMDKKSVGAGLKELSDFAKESAA